ncbi:hypothetical protein BX600DRAFT_518347 [Xylariales sp. PMI_506]|nr:hypothetical protein BX600DRAFT_518347 [Xylariales sp. PMI_506]
MVVVAVAGGSGNLGRTIVEVLKESQQHKVIVLARKAIDTTDPAAPLFVVNYDDVEGTSRILADNNVHTVISTIQVGDETSSAAQVNLVKASAISDPTRRFVANDWGPRHPERSDKYTLREAAFKELRNTSLEWTRFENGYFLDNYGAPYLKSYVRPFALMIDMKNKAAAIPGTGDEPLALTYTFDLARFVAASLDLPEWDETTYCYGDKITLNEVVKLAEEATGSKFIVTYDPIEKLLKGEVTELPSHPYVYKFFPKPKLQGMAALLGSYVAEGRVDVPTDKSLNARFPEIETMKVKDAMELWRGK